jgi:hypothetical protein
MTVEQAWAKWEPYWHLRYDDHHNTAGYPRYVLGRLGDEGEYTVANCRVITHRANTLERDHEKCVPKLKGRVNNPTGGVQLNRGRGVITPMGEYANCVEAAVAYGMHRSSMWHRVCSARYPGFGWR